MGPIRARHIPLILSIVALVIAAYSAAAIRYHLWPVAAPGTTAAQVRHPAVGSNGVYDTDQNLFGSSGQRSPGEQFLFATAASEWRGHEVLKGIAFLTATDENKANFKVQLTGQAPHRTAHVIVGSLHTDVQRLPLLRSAYPKAQQYCAALAGFHRKLVQRALDGVHRWLAEVVPAQLAEPKLVIQVTAPASVWAAPPCAV